MWLSPVDNSQSTLTWPVSSIETTDHISFLNTWLPGYHICIIFLLSPQVLLPSLCRSAPELSSQASQGNSATAMVVIATKHQGLPHLCLQFWPLPWPWITTNLTTLLSEYGKTRTVDSFPHSHPYHRLLHIPQENMHYFRKRLKEMWKFFMYLCV